MAKKRRSVLPYKRFRIKQRGSRKYKYGYVSKITGKRISKKRISKNWRQQAVNELFPTKSVTVLKKTKKTFDEYRKIGESLIASSPDIKRYLDWLKKHDKKRYKTFLDEFSDNG